jgi:UDP:flavonoid glycosyltransferase YjiC (YdhE family)
VDWAKQLNRLAVGGEPLSIESVTEPELSAAIMDVLNNPILRMKSLELNEALQQENGVKKAVELISNLSI